MARGDPHVGRAKGPRWDRRRGWTVALAALAVLAGGLALAGSAAALQDIAMGIECPQDPRTVQPASTPATWACTAQFEYTSANTGMTDPVQPAIVELTFPEAPEWATAVASPQRIVTLGPSNAEEVVEVPLTISVSATTDAPAFQTDQLRVEPVVIQHPRSEGELSRISFTNPTHLTVTPGYMSSYEVRIQPVEDRTRPQEPLRYEIHIDNHSNGPTRFSFRVPGEAPEGFTPMVPEPVIVPGAADSQTLPGNETPESSNATVAFAVQTPYRNGYVNERVPVQLAVDSAFAPDVTVKGVSSNVAWVGQAQGAYVPGPGAWMAALAGLAAAGVARRRV